MKKLLHLLFALATSATAASVLLPYAWAERGFRGGIGGEWVLIACALWLGGYLYREVLRPILDGGGLDD